MEKSTKLFYALLAFSLAVSIHSQDQSGFISIDCGIPAASGYNDETTGIKYVSEETFIDTGISKIISPESQASFLERQFRNVRSFPEGSKNCYTLNPAQGKDNKYLIRARFMYGNYDGEGNVPQFDIYLGVNIWDTIKLDNISSKVTTEIIHYSPKDHIHVCLVNRGLGTPFISSLELRFLKKSTYETQSLFESLVLYVRYDLGSTSNQSFRYKDDVYDRIWMPKNFPGWKSLSTSQPIDVQNPAAFRPAPPVMSTAVTSENVTQNLSFFWEPDDPKSEYYVYMHFCEVELLVNQTREFNISQNNEFFFGPIAPDYLYSATAYSAMPVSGNRIVYSIYQTERSTLPPIINAYEIYRVIRALQSETDQNDIDALVKLKSQYGVRRNWHGDPCGPQPYSWDGLNCSYEDSNPPRIISLNLSSSGLTGEIAPHFADLVTIQHLDLSNNSLSGKVPDFLSELPYLKVLNLRKNKLTGSIPIELMKRSNSGLLSMSVDENPNLCFSSPCEKKKSKKFLIPVVAAVVTLSAGLIAFAILWRLKSRKRQDVRKVQAELEFISDSFTSKGRQFTYSDILRITNNFEKVLGKGGFGSVFHGYLDGTQVAVKMLSSSSAQGYKEFHAEVKLLMRVHHRNLTALVGYCIEGSNMGLLYEYMPNGTLDNFLKGKNEYILSWEERMRIALDAAQGLEYLHNGCKPPIVHRDVKPSNILLSEKLQAKIADFGLSRIYSNESGTHISTVVAGTPGYLDPEYYLSNWLNEKSDVYSFGVVLLEIITSQPVVMKELDENVHISQWVNSKLGEGDIRSIVDQSLSGNLDINSAWRIAELALACASDTSSDRPTMSDVVFELKECLVVEIPRENETPEGHEDKSKAPRRMVTVTVDDDDSPRAR